jgi:hypothetical protein
MGAVFSFNICSWLCSRKKAQYPHDYDSTEPIESVLAASPHSDDQGRWIPYDVL